MPTFITRTTTTLTYVAGTTLENALERRSDTRFYGHVEQDTPAKAYDAIGYFEREEEEEFHVFEFHTVETVKKVEPPYER